MLLSFNQTRSLLEKYSINLVPSVQALTHRQALSAAAALGYPLVLKATGEAVNHKTEKGLVFLNITCLEQLEQSLDSLQERVGKNFAFLLQRQLSGAELIVGGKRDPAFGPTLLFGTGGIYAELLDDVAMRVCPLGKEDAKEMIYSTKASKFLAGFRSRKMNEDAMVALLIKSSRMMVENPWIKEFDFNPVIADETSAIVVDARIVSE